MGLLGRLHSGRIVVVLGDLHERPGEVASGIHGIDGEIASWTHLARLRQRIGGSGSTKRLHPGLVGEDSLGGLHREIWCSDGMRAAWGWRGARASGTHGVWRGRRGGGPWQLGPPSHGELGARAIVAGRVGMGRAFRLLGFLGTVCRARSESETSKYIYGCGFAGAAGTEGIVMVVFLSAPRALRLIVGGRASQGDGCAAVVVVGEGLGVCRSSLWVAVCSSSRRRVGRSPPVPVAVCAQSSCPTLPGRAPGDPASCDPLPFVVFALTPRSPVPLSKPLIR